MLSLGGTGSRSFTFFYFNRLIFSLLFPLQPLPKIDYVFDGLFILLNNRKASVYDKRELYRMYIPAATNWLLMTPFQLLGKAI